MKKFMIDSNVIIEFMKNNDTAVDILNFIKDNQHHEYYITVDTVEEILYVLLKHFSKKSYWELKNDHELAKKIYKEILPLVQSLISTLFKLVQTTPSISNVLFDVCEEYGLLPKDALIFSTCVENNINYLITFDKDFKNLKNTKITIISDYQELSLQ